MGAVPGKGCASPDRTGKPKLSEMAPTWLRPGIKLIYTATAGDFFKIFHFLILVSYLFLRVFEMSARWKGAGSREGSGACDSVKRNSGYTEDNSFISERGHAPSQFRTKIVFVSKAKKQKMGIFSNTYSNRREKAGRTDFRCMVSPFRPAGKIQFSGLPCRYSQ